ncbi:hypothetical protein [Paenibacillus apii]|uniref:hypothetical protein n=1 Tax=Paenibacillus apii TaxID=1850370 RepID=UPI0014395E10|nr:hypothetical protein [Paenibacillus apii]NJJ37848.1 hypothetical protein [Paenibacillus apii]
MNGYYRTINSSVWTPEQIAEYLRHIGADKPPEKQKKFTSITAPQQVQGSRHYSRRGGEW